MVDVDTYRLKILRLRTYFWFIITKSIHNPSKIISKLKVLLRIDFLKTDFLKTKSQQNINIFKPTTLSTIQYTHLFIEKDRMILLCSTKYWSLVRASFFTKIGNFHSETLISLFQNARYSSVVNTRHTKVTTLQFFTVSLFQNCFSRTSQHLTIIRVSFEQVIFHIKSPNRKWNTKSSFSFFLSFFLTSHLFFNMRSYTQTHTRA